jgi:protoporphyrinogen/coproporphyrinogen III oxidase
VTRTMNVAVLGGGVTGLTAAWKLSAAGHSVRLFESAPRLGGTVRTEAVDGWLVEAGPQSFQDSSPEIGALIRELGLGPERIAPGPAARNRYIVRNGELVALPTPSNLAALVATPLFSFGTKLKITGEAARKPIVRAGDVSVADLVRDHFGSEVLERIVQPFIGGIYAGDAERLSARHAFPQIWEAERTTGSLVRAGLEAARKKREAGAAPESPLVSFRGGLQALTDALAARLAPGSVSLGAEVRSVAPGTGARWRVSWEGPEGTRDAPFDSVVCAIPAWGLARLEVAGTRPLATLGEIEHPPVSCVFAGFRRDQVRHPLDGFGALVPSSEKRSVLGVIFSSTLFAGRTPEGHVALTAFTGGALQPEVARLPKAELIERVCADLRDLLGAQGRPAFARHTLWPRAIPQYNLGYGRHLGTLSECEKAHAGLFIGGNARDGISLADCILSGAALAKRVS